ncbi:MAG TPA: hypothetical protein QF700_05990 [Prochlorococcus sp.]|nr:hypothetical protein [Prochlorococcus sp.]
MGNQITNPNPAGAYLSFNSGDYNSEVYTNNGWIKNAPWGNELTNTATGIFNNNTTIAIYNESHLHNSGGTINNYGSAQGGDSKPRLAGKCRRRDKQL